MSTITSFGMSPVEFIKMALAEDSGDGDHTSISTIDERSTGIARVKVKEDGIISGLEVAKLVLGCVDRSLKIHMNTSEGAKVSSGEVVMIVEGNVRGMLKAERLLLNCMQRMSGIATLTGKYVEAVENTNAKILDTRKTTPNFRHFEKLAVRAGGGLNHRFGLYDMILIKNNHVDACGGIINALVKASDYLKQNGKNLIIEIETRNLQEVDDVLKTGIAKRIMLDNFDPLTLKKAVEVIGNKFETEASGGITLSNVEKYAISGVDFISVGALTHSYKSMDINMKIEK